MLFDFLGIAAAGIPNHQALELVSQTHKLLCAVTTKSIKARSTPLT
jgi:hypothetical protein